jgi:hypothetical protein
VHAQASVVLLNRLLFLCRLNTRDPNLNRQFIPAEYIKGENRALLIATQLQIEKQS